MKTVTATIGWTKSDMANGYSSFDGYRPGAQQHTETVTFKVPVDFGAERICWLLLEATNSPSVRFNDASPAGEALGAIQRTGYTGREAHWSLSTGDTVTVDGVMYAFTGYAVEIVKDRSI